MTLLLSLVIFDGYELFPAMSKSERTLAAIEQARRLGTFGKIDRSQQYREDDPAVRTGAALVRSQNHQWTKIRKLELWLKILSAGVTLLGLILTIVKALIR